MNVGRILALLFFLMFGYGLGTGKVVPTALVFGAMCLMLYGERVFKKQDAEHEKYQRIKQSLILTSERMLDLHQCEAYAIHVYNPAHGLQVAD